MMEKTVYLLCQLWLICSIKAAAFAGSGLQVKSVDAKIKGSLKGWESYDNVLKVVTWSMLNDDENPEYDWNDRKEDVCDYLKKMSPTILGLQQVGPNHLQEIKDCLPEHNLVEPALLNEDSSYGYFNPIFYKKDTRFTKDSSGTFWLSSTPTIRGTKLEAATEVAFATWVKMDFSYEASVPKLGSMDKLFNLLHIATEGEVYDQEDDDTKQKPRQTGHRSTTFYIVNTKLDAVNKDVAKQQIDILLSHMKGIVMNRRRNHVILTGNLNLNSKELNKNFKRFDWMKNTMDDARDEYSALTSVDPKTLLGKALVDYVSHDKFKCVLSATLMDLRPNKELLSDHRPVIAALLP